MRSPRVLAVDNTVAGYWRIIVYPKRAGHPAALDITTVRGMPVKLGTFSFSDPFGPNRATLTLPQVTMFDRKGDGDLWWLRPYADIEIRWVGPLPPAYGYGLAKMGWSTGRKLPHNPVLAALVPRLSWYGRIEPFDYDSAGVTLTVKGSLYCVDDYLAKPEYPHAPLPYEWAIAKKFLGHPALGLRPLKVVWPAWWSTEYGPPPKGTPSYLVPQGVSRHQFWTALVTRQTGSWDPALTSFIQTLLASMYTERGRWTLDLMANKEPVLIHRDMLERPNATTVRADVTNPSQLKFTEDWSQAIGAVYGQGQSLAGVRYSGMQVTPDGMLTTYEPLAALRQVHPETNHNEWLDRGRSRKEIMLAMQDGLSELQARDVAEAHLRRFGDPGITGTLTLDFDPTINGVVVPRALVRAGMTLHLPNVLGHPEGVLAHIASNEVNLAEETNQLTFDTKYRDALTVSEVKARGRDSMAVQRMLVVGVYSPPIPDQLIPWDYSTGSGYVPSPPTASNSSQRLFDGMPSGIEFPWEEWTTQRPPVNTKWRHCYIGIGHANKKADFNWTYYGSPKEGRLAVPIRMAQAGQIRLFQMAAYHADGTVAKVPFHVSLYSFHGVGVKSMPEIPYGQRYGTYGAYQRYPFGRDAWETYLASGARVNPNIPQPATQGGLIRGWGDFYEKAGYFPGSSGRGNPPTGLLVDETVWPFDLTSVLNQFNPASTKQVGPYKGQAFMMVYCDAQGDEPVYFLGRMFRVEPGATS